MVVTARGEVFNIPVDKGVTKISPVLRERTNVTLNGHRTETYSLYLRRYRRDRAVSPRFRGGEPTQLTKNNDTYIRTFQWSPDSKKIVYTDRKIVSIFGRI